MTTDFFLHNHAATGRLVGNGNNRGMTAFLVQFRYHCHFLVSIIQVGPFGMRQGFVLFDFIDGRLLVSIRNRGLAHHVIHGLAEVKLGFGGSIKAGF